MKEYKIEGYKILAKDSMLVTFTEDKKTVTVIDKKEREVHCIIDFKDKKFSLDSGWNIKYIFEGNTIQLEYSAED